MTANATLYLKQSLDIFQLRAFSHQAQLAMDHPEQPSRFHLQWADCAVTLNLMPTSQLSEHLQGLLGYVSHLLGGRSDTQNVREQVLATQQAIGLVIEPNWDTEGKLQKLILGLVQANGGFFFAGDALYQGDNNLLLGSEVARSTFFLSPIHQSAEALARRERSFQILQQQGIPYSQHLPPIQDESQSQPPRAEDIAWRALMLSIVAMKAITTDQKQAAQISSVQIKQRKFDRLLTPKETLFIANEQPNQQEIVEFSWRLEAAWVLLWAIGHIETLVYPNVIHVHADTDAIIRQSGYFSDAKVRPISQILDEADLIYRYHWAVRQAQYTRQAIPADLNMDVIIERHHALNWLIGYNQQDWDHISTDT